MIEKKIIPNSIKIVRLRFSLTTGQIIDHMGLNDKVKHGLEFKEHLDIAIRLNNSDYLLFYLRGRWSFKVIQKYKLQISELIFLYCNF